MQQNIDIFNEQKFLERMSGDQDIVKEIIALFLKDAVSLVEEMKVAAGNNDLVFIGKLAHRLKGAAANIDAEALRAVSEEMEMMAREGKVAEAVALMPALIEQMDKFRTLVDH